MPSAAENKTKKYSHGGYAGRTIIQRIEQQMDKRRKAVETIFTQTGNANDKQYLIEKGRYEGLGAALGLLRSSSLQIEVSRSNERLGIE